jgi:hypothetical protein
MITSRFMKLFLYKRPAFTLLAIPLLFIGLTEALKAQEAPANNPPVRGVRLSDVEGSVKVEQGNDLITDQATANLTLYEGMRITTINDGRAEVQLDDGSLIRLTPASVLTLNLLRQEGTQSETEIELNNGLGYFELKPAREGSGLRVKFGDTLVTATLQSTLRINFDMAPGTVSVTVGEVHVERASGLTVDVHAGENLDLDPRDPAKYSITEQITPDSWDGWNRDRDLVLSGEASLQTPASESMANGSAPAWNDLDANGSWYNVPDVGPVWSPYDAAYSSWDPYGYGYWVWYPRFGYVWVSGESWGYLPYRCGLWNFYDGFGWGWSPGFGGCNPWFVGGFWFGNYRNGPGGWHYPHPPRGPVGHFPHPLVAVNHNTTGGRLIRPVNGPATIAGHSVTPLHSVAARGAYSQPGGVSASSRASYGSSVGGYRPGGTAGGGTAGGGTRPSPASGHATSTTHASSGGGGGGGGSHASSGGGGGGSHGGGGGGGHH